MPRILTVGHSTQPLERFLETLSAHGVVGVADVRRYPGSRRHPWFSRDALQRSLPASGVEYRWFPDLGGRRETGALSEDNAGWRVAAFHAFADWMREPPFLAAVTDLLAWAETRPVAVMCAEALWTKCHRRLIADSCTARGWEVVHLLGPARQELHQPPPFARIADGAVSYPAGARR